MLDLGNFAPTAGLERDVGQQAAKSGPPARRINAQSRRSATLESSLVANPESIRDDAGTSDGGTENGRGRRRQEGRWRRAPCLH